MEDAGAFVNLTLDNADDMVSVHVNNELRTRIPRSWGTNRYLTLFASPFLGGASPQNRTNKSGRRSTIPKQNIHELHPSPNFLAALSSPSDVTHMPGLS